MMTEEIKARLEYLRGEIAAERISQDEIVELQGLADHIDPGDTVLLEWAGVPEFDGPPHVGHWSRLGGLWYCDTCDSPYCDLA
jgi:hypothetical protein